MDEALLQKFKTAGWIGSSLFNRCKVSGSSANLSFLHNGILYITGSGVSFGNLADEDFSAVSPEGSHLSGPKPSKELELHRIIYQNRPEAQAVLHTHSTYATLWSCLDHPNPQDVIPPYTPYLDMKVGTVGLVEYAPPGSSELFANFAARVQGSGGWLLRNHGPIVAGKSLMDAFYCIEELEESAKIPFLLRGAGAQAPCRNQG